MGSVKASSAAIQMPLRWLWWHYSESLVLRRPEATGFMVSINLPLLDKITTPLNPALLNLSVCCLAVSDEVGKEKKGCESIQWKENRSNTPAFLTINIPAGFWGWWSCWVTFFQSFHLKAKVIFLLLSGSKLDMRKWIYHWISVHETDMSVHN